MSELKVGDEGWFFLGKSVPSRNEMYRTPAKTADKRLRRALPYGMWTCADGREVLFNRDYAPIWQRRPGQAAEKADHGEWVKDLKHQQFLFHDGNSPWLKRKESAKARARCDRALSDFLAGEKMRDSLWK